MENFKIKIGKLDMEVEPGEYFMDNGACLQFITKDTNKQKRVKGFRGFGGHCPLRVPKKRLHLIKKNPLFTRTSIDPEFNTERKHLIFYIYTPKS